MLSRKQMWRREPLPKSYYTTIFDTIHKKESYQDNEDEDNPVSSSYSPEDSLQIEKLLPESFNTSFFQIIEKIFTFNQNKTLTDYVLFTENRPYNSVHTEPILYVNQLKEEISGKNNSNDEICAKTRIKRKVKFSKTVRVVLIKTNEELQPYLKDMFWKFDENPPPSPLLDAINFDDTSVNFPKTDYTMFYPPPPPYILPFLYSPVSQTETKFISPIKRTNSHTNRLSSLGPASSNQSHFSSTVSMEESLIF
jgi:hypothetical protein